ncbi:MAG: hypothetical protein IT257_09610 [Chitinophagaceae bacterium]|nr:hypothetical protein [Chitinophagaceae bacterium]
MNDKCTLHAKPITRFLISIFHELFIYFAANPQPSMRHIPGNGILLSTIPVYSSIYLFYEN